MGDIKNFINNKLNNEVPQQASTLQDKDWTDISSGGVQLAVNPKYSHSTIMWTDETEVKVEDRTAGETIVHKDDNNNEYAYGMTKDGEVSLRITNCAVDEKGNVCDVIVKVTRPKVTTDDPQFQLGIMVQIQTMLDILVL